ncbi:MAG: DUF3365 domain-containing protein [Sulfuricurvum sp.]|nr:DUF3365 domain-containing protein [Sulfuricurvum sp.]
MLTPTLKWSLSSVWIAIVAGSVWFNFSQIDSSAVQMAITEGRAGWFTDQAYRQWVIGKGGIYVPPNEKYPPSPYLSHIPERDISTPSGKPLTLINSSYMVRQVHDMAPLSNAAKVHITSLRPLRPENRADAWESKALKLFEKGEKEIWALSEINGTKYLRLMRPMLTTQECLKCHGRQGYEVGDIRGGVSVSVPFAPYEEAASNQKQSLLLWHVLIGLLGILGIWFAFSRIVRNEKLLQNALKDSENAKQTVMELNETLEAKVRDEVAKSRQKDLLLIQQSRLASMGEMIHIIAHQWRQPLNTLAVILANIQDDYKYNELSEESLSNAVAKSRKILNQMSQTIDDFRNFFRSDKEAKPFDTVDIIEESLVVIDAALKNNNIEIVKEYERPLPGYGYPNQLSQVILNLLTNAKDAVKERKSGSGKIVIRAFAENGDVRIEISDNAGGIDEAIIGKIFDPYFTTKESGSGIGLYMARMIVEHNHGGTISAVNTGEGAEFTIRIPHHAQMKTQKDG